MIFSNDPYFPVIAWEQGSKLVLNPSQIRMIDMVYADGNEKAFVEIAFTRPVIDRYGNSYPVITIPIIDNDAMWWYGDMAKCVANGVALYSQCFSE